MKKLMIMAMMSSLRKILNMKRNKPITTDNHAVPTASI